MKKLMTVAAVLTFGCVAHAASFTWGFSSDKIIKPGGGAKEYLEGGTAFLYLGTVTASDTAFNLSAETFFASAGQDTSFNNFGVFDEDNPASSDVLDSTAKGLAYTLILVDKSVTSLVDYEGHYIIAKGDSGQDTDPDTGATWATFIDSTAYSGSAWSTMPVPEPTSGLLLLGMAGLALKRKRA